MSNPFLNRVAKRDNGHHGRKAEGNLAKRLQGSQQPGSGAIAGAKGDVKKDTPSFSFLIESKATKSESMSLKQDWLLKIYQEALEVGRTPALALSFTRENGSSEKRDRWVMVPEHVFQQLIEDSKD